MTWYPDRSLARSSGSISASNVLSSLLLCRRRLDGMPFNPLMPLLAPIRINTVSILSSRWWAYIFKKKLSIQTHPYPLTVSNPSQGVQKASFKQNCVKAAYLPLRASPWLGLACSWSERIQACQHHWGKGFQDKINTSTPSSEAHFWTRTASSFILTN